MNKKIISVIGILSLTACGGGGGSTSLPSVLTPVPTPIATNKPVVNPTATPTVKPTQTPIVVVSPTANPTVSPTATPSTVPSIKPSPVPSISPSPVVTVAPTIAPTLMPIPSATPTVTPTMAPTATPVPTSVPSPVPSATPTVAPTATPTPVYNNTGAVTFNIISNNSYPAITDVRLEISNAPIGFGQQNFDFPCTSLATCKPFMLLPVGQYYQIYIELFDGWGNVVAGPEGPQYGGYYSVVNGPQTITIQVY